MNFGAFLITWIQKGGSVFFSIAIFRIKNQNDLSFSFLGVAIRNILKCDWSRSNFHAVSKIILPGMGFTLGNIFFFFFFRFTQAKTNGKFLQKTETYFWAVLGTLLQNLEFSSKNFDLPFIKLKPHTKNLKNLMSCYSGTDAKTKKLYK